MSRFQLQTEPMNRSQASKYSSISQALRSVYAEEGFRSLWRYFEFDNLSVYYYFWNFQRQCTCSVAVGIILWNTGDICLYVNILPWSFLPSSVCMTAFYASYHCFASLHWLRSLQGLLLVNNETAIK